MERIRSELENFNRESTDWERIRQLQREYDAIKGPLKGYVISRAEQYEEGQVFSEVPTDAVPVDEFFKQE